LERKPAEAIKTENTKLDTKVSTWGKIQSAFSSLQDAASALNSDAFWTAAKATSSDASTVGVTTSASQCARLVQHHRSISGQFSVPGQRRLR
jgi:flagellar hook-associated protein 2